MGIVNFLKNSGETGGGLEKMLYLYEKNLKKSLAITLVGSGRVDSVTPIIKLKKDAIFIERKTDFSL